MTVSVCVLSAAVLNHPFSLPFSPSLIINNGLKEGSQLPYIRRAREAGYGVLVLNTNDNRRVTSERKQFIRVSICVALSKSWGGSKGKKCSKYIQNP